MVVEKNNRETDKDKDGKRNSKGDPDDTVENGKKRKSTSNVKNEEKTEESDHHIWRDERRETEKKTQTEEDRGSDGIKMSEGHDKNTNKLKEQDGEERKKEMEIKVERNNEKPKQTESIGRAEKTINVGEVEDGEIGTEIKTEREKRVQSVQRDSDGELVSSKATERTGFVSISPTLHSIISLAPRPDSMDSNEAITFTSSFPPPPLSSSTSNLITDVNQGMTKVVDRLPTQSTGPGAAGISEHPSLVSGEGFRTTSKLTTTATINTLGGPKLQITSAIKRFNSTTSARPGAGFHVRVSSTTATTTTAKTPRQSLYTTAFPGVAVHSRWTAKKNSSSNTKTDVNLLPGQGPKQGDKHKPVIMSKADQKLKNPKNHRKPDRASLPDKKTKHDQKQKSSNQKLKPGKGPKQVQIPKPELRPLPDHLPTDQDLKKNQTPKYDQEHTTDQSQLLIQKPKSHLKPIVSSVQRTTSHQRPTGSDPQTDRQPVVEISEINQNSKPKKKPVHPLKTDKRDQTEKPPKKTKSEAKTQPDQRSTTNQYFTSVQKPERREKTITTPKSTQKPKTESMENSDENPLPEPKSVKDSTPGQKLTPDHALIKPPDQKPKPSQNVPKINQKPKLNQKHPELLTDQKTKPKAKLKPEQTPETNQGLGSPRPDQMRDLKPKYVPDEIPEAESNKTSKPRPPPRRRPSTRATVRPGATPVQRPKTAVQLKPSLKTKTDLGPPQISGTTSDDIQSSQTDVPPAPGSVTRTAEVSRSPGDAELSPSMMKTTTLGPKTSNSRTTSDLRPQTAGRPPSIPMTTRPNKIIRGSIPSTSPGSTKPSQASNTDSILQAMILHNVEEIAPSKFQDPDKMMIPVPTPSAQTTSTISPNLRSTTPATSGPETPAAESSTPSARELRVKINQVDAFFNNSPNGRPPDRLPKDHPEDNQGGSRPDSKQSTLKPSKVTMPRDCSDHLLRGGTKSGVYLVTPDLRSRSFSVLCDMELDAGGWTLLQRRQDGSVSFNRTWAEYRSGFGELDGGEFWLGNNMIHLLTRDRDIVLRVELEDFGGVMEYAEYQQFMVASERMRYRLTVGAYSGTAGDSLRFSKSYDHNNRAFTTPDRDHDRYPSGNCGAYYSSGWWFDSCMAANLNGRYYVGSYKGVRDGIFWGTWHDISTGYYPTNERQSFKTVRMMIRPKSFAP
ncbi:mucin-5AC-like [Anarrhichthys ocellatus]|uniref:mucin-5AC-like n=1 Tax=Anarrhichthys ocellatus TaxID=433405 RepID=UPI0012EE1EB4|nr:mucin-5AC-like [Anarrhichthys ocellatus]